MSAFDPKLPFRPKALLFDFDGVLINSLPVMKLAFSAALDEIYPDENRPHDLLFAEYQKYLGMGFPQIMRNLGLSQDMFAPFRKHSRILAPYVQMYDGAVGLLDWARARDLRMGIATGKDIERTFELLEQLKIREYFCAVYASDTVSAPKPAPEMAQRFAQDLGLGMAEFILVGDAAADIRCGQAAGCRTAAAAWGYTDRAELQALGPTYLFETPLDAQTQLTPILQTRAWSS
ncbi:AHBA synthesis associated protein [Yoonia tamlensis]|uniref:phosphoglycolate phosphatase n=1 Tax=Yoonia tamlensis TaxID=390270 RepID=A0A1I6HUW4_9RHOB|nr:HAD family hydrolase [Yoonia tamlensis]SFR58239.1 AHBA synthesis associated protein [Yoonia tamlensis]